MNELIKLHLSAGVGDCLIRGYQIHVGKNIRTLPSHIIREKEKEANMK